MAVKSKSVCKYGDECYRLNNPKHRALFAHPHVDQIAAQQEKEADESIEGTCTMTSMKSDSTIDSEAIFNDDDEDDEFEDPEATLSMEEVVEVLLVILYS